MLNNGHISLDNDTIIATCINYVNKLNIRPAPDGTVSTHPLAVAKNINSDRLGNNAYGVNESHLANSDSFQQPHTWDVFSDLINVIKELTGKPVQNSWFNIMPPGARRGEHAHLLASHSVFVYYPDKVEDDVDILLLENESWVPVHCLTGDWIQFSKTCVHKIPENKSSHNRISVAFNV